MELTKKHNITMLSTAIFVIINAVCLISGILFNAGIHAVLLLLGTAFSVAATVMINRIAKSNGGKLLRVNLIWFLSVILVGAVSLTTALILQNFKVNAIPFMLSVECFLLAALLSVFFCCLNNVNKPSKYLVISSVFCFIMTLATSICIEVAIVSNTGTLIVIIAALVSYTIASAKGTVVIRNEKIPYRLLIHASRIILTSIVVYLLNSLPVFLWGRSWDSNNTTSVIIAILTFCAMLISTLVTEITLVFVRKRNLNQ